jgi:hypothetical protein
VPVPENSKKSWRNKKNVSRISGTGTHTGTHTGTGTNFF